MIHLCSLIPRRPQRVMKQNIVYKRKLCPSCLSSQHQRTKKVKFKTMDKQRKLQIRQIDMVTEEKRWGELGADRLDNRHRNSSLLIYAYILRKGKQYISFIIGLIAIDIIFMFFFFFFQSLWVFGCRRHNSGNDNSSIFVFCWKILSGIFY